MPSINILSSNNFSSSSSWRRSICDLVDRYAYVLFYKLWLVVCRWWRFQSITRVRKNYLVLVQIFSFRLYVVCYCYKRWSTILEPRLLHFSLVGFTCTTSFSSPPEVADEILKASGSAFSLFQNSPTLKFPLCNISTPTYCNEHVWRTRSQFEFLWTDRSCRPLFTSHFHTLPLKDAATPSQSATLLRLRSVSCI